jgi:hypothetical protein
MKRAVASVIAMVVSIWIAPSTIVVGQEPAKPVLG